MDGFAGFMQAVDLGAQLWSAQRARSYGQKMQIQNQNWMERMSSSAASRHFADLKRAGVNPLLGITSGAQASSPQSQPAPTFRDYEPGSINSGAAAAMMVAKAQARKLNAEAALTEFQIPHGAASAQAGIDKLQDEVVRLGQDIEKADIDIRQRRMESEQYAKMGPLLIEAQRIANASGSYGLARQKLISSIAEKFQWPVDRVDDFVKMLNEFGSSVGTSVADAEEWLRKNLPRFLEGARRGLAR